MNIERDGFTGRGAETGAKPQFPLPVLNQVSQQYTTTTFNAGTDFTIGAGAAGTVVTIHMKYGHILGNYGRVGRFGESSFAFGGAAATTFTTEVPYKTLDNSPAPDTTGQLTTNGYYMVDYETGTVYGKKADTGTTGTATFSYWLGGGGSSDITSIIPGTGATNLGKAEDAATASGDTGVAILERRIDTLASSAGADGDYAFKNQDSIGASYGREVYATTAEDNTVGVFKVEQRFSYSYISSATTTTVKSGAGFLNAITITEAVASTIIVYDNTAGSGTIIASFVASAGVGTYHFNVSFGTGLTIVTAGASKLTTSYR